MKREIGDYIQDILDAMDNAARFIEGMSYGEFLRILKQSMQS